MRIDPRRYEAVVIALAACGQPAAVQTPPANAVSGPPISHAPFVISNKIVAEDGRVVRAIPNASAGPEVNPSDGRSARHVAAGRCTAPPATVPRCSRNTWIPAGGGSAPVRPTTVTVSVDRFTVSSNSGLNPISRLLPHR